MPCRTSFFNASVYKSCLKRFWPVWAALIFTWALTLALPVLNMDSGYEYSLDAQNWVQNAGGYGGIIISAVYSVLAAMTVYSWLFNARSTGFTCALPIRREAMLLSCWAAGYTMLAGSGIVTALLTLLCGIGKTGVAASLLPWLGQYLLMSLFFFGLASLCALLTGTLWVLPVVYAVLNVVVVVLWYLVSYVLEALLFGYSMNIPDEAAALSPIVRMFMAEWGVSPFEDWVILVVYALVGVIFSFCALLLCRKRQMETATDIVSVQVLKPVFRWCAAITIALGLGNLLYEILVDGYQPVAMGLFLLLGAFIGWVAAEMLVRKSYRVRSCLKTFPICAALLIAFVAVCATGFFGYSKRVPAAEDVKQVIVDNSYGSGYCTITERADIELICEVHAAVAAETQRSGGWWSTVEFSYELKNGKTMYRSFHVEELGAENERKLSTAFTHAEIAMLKRNLQKSEWTARTDVTYQGELRDYYSFSLSERNSRMFAEQYLLPLLERGEIAAECVRAYDSCGDSTDWEESRFTFELGIEGEGVWSWYRFYSYTITPKQKEAYDRLLELMFADDEWKADFPEEADTTAVYPDW